MLSRPTWDHRVLGWASVLPALSAHVRCTIVPATLDRITCTTLLLYILVVLLISKHVNLSTQTRPHQSGRAMRSFLRRTTLNF